ncbi:phosphodiester glycosidase family protein [Thetidibacter halocola]|uniref:Phosphodiester glycosidase family protein n=1 Tax=Thetidibacter halocola TaxID=2827239 RepID=A0A8J7WJR2_9RHOB|nr:phosphodiester glycosidase family protein [Thetidibacter halocola]MBS0126328.1 phosphodiester glycosidase family protein [Thetidibacter halocola]
MRRLALLLSLSLGFATQTAALECEQIRHIGNRYTICSVDPAEDELRLFLDGPDGARLGQFDAVSTMLAARGESLLFAMNAGMYHADRSPVGHYVERGRERMRVIPNPGPGNFGLLPNGIFCIGRGTARVYETRDYLERRPSCRYATQSGPMLVIDGALHPRFLPDSTSRYIRNGVGTSKDGRRAVFAISDNAVTFHEFGRLFRDILNLPDALFFDGNVSRLFAPQVGRNDPGRMMGPIVGVVGP